MIFMFFSKSRVSDAVGIGCLLWLMGFALSLALFALLPERLMGQVILTIMAPVSFVIAFYRLRFKSEHILYFVLVGIIWLFIAIVLDYIFIVTLFSIKNYYDAEVVFYYLITLIIPILIGYLYRRKTKRGAPR